MGFKMNRAMKELISKLTERGISVDIERDNCIVYKRNVAVGDRTDAYFVLVTPYKAVGGVNYYLVRTDTQTGLTRMSLTKTIDTIVETSTKEVSPR